MYLVYTARYMIFRGKIRGTADSISGCWVLWIECAPFGGMHARHYERVRECECDKLTKEIKRNKSWSEGDNDRAPGWNTIHAIAR